MYANLHMPALVDCAYSFNVHDYYKHTKHYQWEPDGKNSH